MAANLIYQNPYQNITYGQLSPLDMQLLGMPQQNFGYYPGTPKPIQDPTVFSALNQFGFTPLTSQYTSPGQYTFSGTPISNQIGSLSYQQILDKLPGLSLQLPQGMDYNQLAQKIQALGTPFNTSGIGTGQTTAGTTGPAQLSPYEQMLQNILGLLSGTQGTGRPQKYAYELDQLNPFFYGNLTGLGLPAQSPLFSTLSGNDNLYKLLGGR